MYKQVALVCKDYVEERQVQLDSFCISGTDSYELLASRFRSFTPKNKLFVCNEQEATWIPNSVWE
jgi:hypothetical protein